MCRTPVDILKMKKQIEERGMAHVPPVLSRLVQPQIYDTHPQPQTDRYRRRLRESDVTLPGWGANLGWRQETLSILGGSHPAECQP